MQPLINPVMTSSVSAPNFSSSATVAAPPSGGATNAAEPFSDLFSDAVGQVNQLEDQARGAVQGLMTGSGVDVHQAMIATQKASMAFELALAVRNKAVQAYQQVIGMQF
jgi:flagellar hook-basal body complex protein FliE